MYLKTENFEGHLSVLLDLVEKKKMDISSVSLARIAEQFVEYVKKLDDFPAPAAASFIETASILILIKSQSLIPQMTVTDEERQSVEELERRLAAYQFVRGLSAVIKRIYAKRPMFEREAFADIGIRFCEPADLSLEKIAAAIKNVLNSFPKAENLPEAVVKNMIKLEEKILELTLRIRQSAQTRFSDFFGKEEFHKIKTEIIVSFLALLELIRQGMAIADQEKNFEEINIRENSIKDSSCLNF